MDIAYSQLGCNHESTYSYISGQITDIEYSGFCNFHLHKIQDGVHISTQILNFSDF